MAERETKSTAEQEKTRRRYEAQPVAEQSKQGGLLEYGQLSEFLSGLSFVEQSSLVNGSGLVGTQKAEAILALQQTYGNRYVANLAEGNGKMNPREDSFGRQPSAGAKPLEHHIRSEMEKVFSKDLGGVKVVEGDGVAESTGNLAVTTGETIHFAPGVYTPETKLGRQILGHELAHYIQQTAAGSSTDSSIDLESEAREAGYQSALGQEVSIAGAATFGQPQGGIAGPPLSQLQPILPRAYSVAEVLAENDPDLVSRLTREQIARASEEDRIALIRLVMRQIWVGPSDESEIVMIWSTFTNLPDVAGRHIALWRQCIERGAELDELPAVRELQNNFREDVITIARNYLFTNRRHVVSEMERIGVSESPTGPQPIAGPSSMTAGRARPVTAEQAARTQEIQEIAMLVLRAQEAEQALRRIPVGYSWVRTSYWYGEEMGRNERVLFDPNRRPQDPPRGNEQPPMASWDNVKREHDRVTNLIAGFANRYPIIYALIRENRLEDLVRTGDQGQARIIIAEVMRRLLDKIDDTIPKIGGDLDYRDLSPIHAQLMAGQAASRSSAVTWNQPLPRWVIEQTMRDYESSEFWRSLILGGIAAVAFIVAELATFGGATFFIAAGVGLVAGALQAGMSWERYLDLAQASETNVSNETALLVASEQVSSALLSAVLDTVFVFLDAYGVAARAVRAAGPIIAESLLAGAERAAIPATIDITSAEARELVQRSISELGVEETMLRTGKSLNELVAFVGEDTPAGRQLRAYEQAVRQTAEAGVTTTEDITALLSNLGEEITAGRLTASQAEQLVVQAIGNFGPKQTIEIAGGWKKLTSELSPGSAAGAQLEEWRHSLYVELQNYIVGRVTTEEGQELIRRTGTRGFKSDMDITLLGPNAAANRDRVRSFLAGRLDIEQGELERLLDLGLFTDPRRMHLFDVLPAEMREQLARELAIFERDLIWNRRLYDALRTEDPLLISEVRSQMSSLGVQETRFTPLSPEDIRRLNQEIDSLHSQLAEAVGSGNTDAQLNLIRDIAQRQAMVNASETGGYYSGGAVRELVSERPGEVTPIPLVEGAPRTLTTLTTDQFTSVLNQLPMLDHEAQRLLDAVGGLREGTATVADVASALKSVAKYGNRLTSGVSRALGVNVPDMVAFDQIERAFRDIMSRYRAGTLQHAVASQEFGELISQTQRALNQLTDSSVGIMRELQSHAGIHQTASGNLGNIQFFIRAHTKMLRATDNTLLQIRSVSRVVLAALWEREQQCESRPEQFTWEAQ